MNLRRQSAFRKDAMNIKHFRIIIALITIFTVVLIRSANFALANSANVDLPNIIFVLINAVILWTFNIALYEAEEKNFLKGKTYPAKFALRIVFNFALSLTLTSSSIVYADIVMGKPFDFPHILLNIMRGLIFDGLVLLTLYTIDLLYKTQKVEIENEKLKNQNLAAQLQTLRQQMQPHFLFNSLNTLKSVVKSDAASAEEFIMRLSDFYRFTLQMNISDKITVSEEMEMLETYIYLLKKRFEENIIFRISLSNAERIQIPPLALQTLVENCIKHNVISMSKPLYIDIFEENKWIVIKNNLQKKNISEPSSHTGLANLQKRYMLLCGKEIEVTETETEFIVKLPVIE